ncbi:hypothetical protein GCM10023093_22250 [Nemorincola caseinilytica]|uniref:Secretion system C-terminal sorting domain-containing protein n=1 Tax=Nemorincola caseinilytica TaxID=2054315 RepID=A0ABP8NJX0_9BACT
MKKTIMAFLCLISIPAFAQTITTVAGNGTSTFSGDGVQATATAVSQPYDVGMDTYGNLYIGNVGNNRIRKVDPTGIITTVAGTGVAGYNGDGIMATTAQLNFPYGMAVSTFGSIVITDMNNDRVRLINNEGSLISTIAGTGVAGYSGDGGPAIAAKINKPQGIFWDSAGNVYFSDAHNNRVRKVGIDGIITTIGGNGTATSGGDGGPATAAGINHPSGLAVDKAGNIYVAEMMGDRIRKISASGIITTIAGTGVWGYSGDGGAATLAMIKRPKGVCIDKLGNIIIADTDNQKIRKIDINTGIISNIAGGSSVAGYSGDGGPATAAQLNFHQGIYVDTFGNLYAGDCLNNRVRKITCNAPVVSAISGPDTLCTGGNITLSSATAGGTWSSMHAKTTVSGGVVTGMTVGMDTIIYTVTNWCFARSVTRPVYVKACPITGINTGGMVQGTRIYPDPARDEVTIVSAVKISDIVITDMSGKAMFSNTYDRAQVSIDISAMPAGVYLVRVNGMYSGKFVKL